MTNSADAEATRRSSRWWRPGRVRVLIWIVGVTGMGLTLLVLGASFALRANIAADIETALEQETGELRRFSAEAVDPETGEPFTTAQGFIETYLARQEPAPSEILVGASLVTAADGSARVARSGPLAPEFAELDAATKSAISTPSSSGTLSTPLGQVSWHNVQIRAADGLGYVAVGIAHQPHERELMRQVALLALLALGALGATGVAAWLASERILLPAQRFERLALQTSQRTGLVRMPENGTDEDIRLARAANRLIRSSERALESEQQFTDDLAHAIRTPLTILRGTLEQPGDTPDQQTVSRGKALAELRHLTVLVDKLVVLNRVDRPDFFSITPDIDLEAYTRAFVSGWARRHGWTGQVDVRLGETATGTAPLDEPRLAQALDELVANAVRASAPGGAVIVSSEVSVVTREAGSAARTGSEHGDDSGAYNGAHGEAHSEAHDGPSREVVRFTVTDSGRGIPEEERDLVVERFGRASNDPQPGEGLGLTVAAKLAEGMGGRLLLETGPDGSGTAATIELPASRD